MATLATFLAKVKLTVKDDAATFSDGNKQDWIAEAVREYSLDKPRVRVAELTGDGVAYAFSTPTGWAVHQSTIESIEYPVDQRPRVFLVPGDDYEVTEAVENTEKISLITVLLASAAKARVRFLTPHTVDGLSSSVPDVDFDAVCNLAASFVANALASFYAESTKSTISADPVNQIEKSALFAAQSEALMRLYDEHVSPDAVKTGVLRHVSLDMQGEKSLLFHRKRFQ